MSFNKRILALFCVLVLAGCKGDPKVQRDKFFNSAQQYFKDGKYSEASIQYRNALRADNGHVPTYLGLAKTFQRLGEHQNAMGAFRKVLQLDGKNAEAKLNLGTYMIAGGGQNQDLFKRAQQYAEEVLAIEPNNLEARILLGNAFSGQNDLDKAAGEMGKVLAADPANLSAALNLGAIQLRQKNPDKAEETFKEALKKHPDSIQALLSVAAFYVAIQKPQEAEGYLKKAFDLAPDDGRSLYALVGYYLAGRKEAEAEEVFKQAIARKPASREPRWGLANFYLRRGKPEEGLKSLRDMLKNDPKDRQVILLLAEVYMGQKKWEEAEKQIGGLLATNKNDPEAHFLLGRISVARGEDTKAYQEFDNAIKLKDSMLAAYLEKASLLMKRGDLEGAQNALNEVLKRDRDNLPAKGALAKVLAYRQKPQDALQLAQQVLEAMPNNQDALMASGDAFAALGKFNEAKTQWLKLCGLQPENPNYWRRLGLVEVAQKDFTGAMNHFRKALELKPDFTLAINDLLYLYTKDKKYDAALAELERLSKASPVQDEIHSFRGRIYLAQGKGADAEREFRKTIELNPKNYQAYILLGQLNLQRNNLDQAVKEMDQLIMKDSKFAPAFLLKAYYLQAAKNTGAAIANYRKTLELEPQNVVAANNLAWLLCESNTNLDEALGLAQAARARVPENPEIADTLGWIYYKKKNYVLATDQLLFSVNNRKAEAEHYYRLGMACYAKGDIQLARQTLQKALEMKPAFEGADDARKILKQTM